LALANGKSCFITRSIKGHSETNMHIIKKFISVDYEVEKNDDCVKIICKGASN